MVVSTDLEIIDGTAELFPAATPADRVAKATEAANALIALVKDRRLSTRIGSNEHIQIEAWQALGSMVGVHVVKDGGVIDVPWPRLAKLGEEPEDKRTAAHQAWDLHRKMIAARSMGLTYGYVCAFHAMKNGHQVGWGEGRCVRSEAKWVDRDDYALSGMAQTRGQSRTFAGALRFIPVLAGYSGTPAEEAAGESAISTADEDAMQNRIRELEAELIAVKTRHLTYGTVADADADTKAAQAIQGMFPEVDGVALVQLCCRRFQTEHLPYAAARMVDAIRWAQDGLRPKETPDASADTGAPSDESTEE